MALKTKVKALLAGGAGAVAIAAAMLGGHDGLEGRRYEPYRDVVGVITVCDGHTGKDIVPGKHYTDAECDALLNQDLAQVAARIDPLIKASMPMLLYAMPRWSAKTNSIKKQWHGRRKSQRLTIMTRQAAYFCSTASNRRRPKGR